MTKQESHATTHSDSMSVEVASTRAGGDVQTKGVIVGEFVTAFTTMLTAVGGMKMLLEMVKLWVEERKERRIKLKRGDVELELQGSMSRREIQQKIEIFRELTKDSKESDVKIILP